MSDKKYLRPRFARLQRFLGAWTLGGISILLFAGDSAFLGTVFGLITLGMLGSALSGFPKRERPYRRIELVSLWIVIPLLLLTLIVLASVGFLPGRYTPWLATYGFVILVILFSMIREVGIESRPT